MNRLDTTQVALIKASKGIYRASVVANHYGVAVSTVTRIWSGQRRADVCAASDFPEIYYKARPVDMQEDITTLLKRGLTPAEVAEQLNISERSVWAYRGIYI